MSIVVVDNYQQRARITKEREREREGERERERERVKGRGDREEGVHCSFEGGREPSGPQENELLANAMHVIAGLVGLLWRGCVLLF